MTAMSIPSSLPFLSRGTHAPGDGKMCAMNAASYISGRLEEDGDRPKTVHGALHQLFIRGNDGLNDEKRQRLWMPMLDALGTDLPDRLDLQVPRRVTVGLAVWAARGFLRGQPAAKHRAGADALEVAQAWLETPTHHNRRRVYRNRKRDLGCHGCVGCAIALAAEQAILNPAPHRFIGTMLVSACDQRIDPTVEGEADIRSEARAMTMLGFIAEAAAETRRLHDLYSKHDDATPADVVPWDDLTAQLGTAPAIA